MSEQSAGTTDSLPRPTPRQLVIRAIGTAVVLALIAVGLVLVVESRDDPADVNDLVQAPRDVSYGRLSLQIPADWTKLADVDECGHVQGDTLILGLAGEVTCPDGERDPDATDVVMSSLTGRMAAPAPDVRFRPVTLPSGLRAERGTTLTDPAAMGGADGDQAGDAGSGGAVGGDSDGGGTDGDESDEDETPLRTTVLRIPSLNAQVVATSPDRQRLVKGILNSARRVPDESGATPTVAYLYAALDIPPDWEVNAVDCGVPTTDTVIAGHADRPEVTGLPGESCPPKRPAAVSDIYLDALDSAFGKRWGVIANDPVTLLNGVKGVRGTRVRPEGEDVTVVVVPDLRAIAVARSSNQALVDLVLSTMHRAVPTPPAQDQPTPTTTPEPTARPTLPAGVKTRTVRYDGLALAVPLAWSETDLECGVPQSDTVVLGAPPAVTGPPRCTADRPPGVSEIVIDRLYNGYGSLWQSVATDPITLPSGLSGLRGVSTSAEGLPVTVLAFPTIDAIIVASAADDGDAQALIDGILTTTRETRDTTRSAG